MKYFVDLDISYPGYAEVEADSPQEALEKAKMGEFEHCEIPTVSWGDYILDGVRVFDEQSYMNRDDNTKSILSWYNKEQ